MKEDTDYLFNVIGTNFRYTIDPEGKNYCRLTLDWNYALGYVDIHMPKYIHKTLQKLMYIPKTSLQHSRHKHTPIQYGNKEQHIHINDSPKLDTKETK